MFATKQDWKQYQLFQDLPQSGLELLSRTAREVTYESKEVLFHEGEEADKFFLVMEGNVAIEMFVHNRGPVTIQTIGPGEVLGWSWLVEPYRWHFDAQATMLTTAISFDARLVRESLDRQQEFGFTMIKRFLPIIVERLQATRLQLLDVYHVHH